MQNNRILQNESLRIPRILIAGSGSGCGKTTLTCALMAALSRRKGLIVQPFKCGPDYIDPMFHTHVTGRASSNLDPFMLSHSTLRFLMQKNALDADISVIEGVMGFYDGRGTTTEAGTFEVASLTQTPVLLVLHARGISASLAAIVKGFTSFRPDHGIAGILLNGIGERLYAPLKSMIENETGTEVLGFLPRMENCSLESRHLGLITAAETEGLDAKIENLAQQATQSMDLERILAIASAAPPMNPEASPLETASWKDKPSFRLAVARDAAFCFYYHDALDLLKEVGAEIVFFSPLEDTRLPENTDGLYLGGGYPELHAARLASNRAMTGDIRSRILNGLPTYAECGGFMYLSESIRTGEGAFGMSGIFENEPFMTQHPVRFGYVDLTAKRASVLVPEGWKGRGHEFHYSDSPNNGDAFEITKPDGRTWSGIHTQIPTLPSPTLHAGYPHLHLYSDPQMAVNFAQACRKYKNRFLPDAE